MDDCEIPGAAVLRQLDRILASEDFDASERNRNFLRFVVEEALEGRAERIKAYTVATSVFGRTAGFDPQLDSIVRIEAGRLRRSLERYYLTAGSNDPVRIDVPKGTYVPKFSFLPATDQTGNGKTQEPISPDGPSLIVDTFVDESEPVASPLFASGFTRDLIVGLMRFRNLAVFSSDVMPATSHNGNSGISVDGSHNCYRLSGSIRQGNDRLVVEALLVNSNNGRLVWADRYESHLFPKDVLATREEIAAVIARSIAQTHGVIFQSLANRTETKPPEFMSSYEAVMQFYNYSKTYDLALFKPVFAALTSAVRKDPHYSDAHACLSLMHTDAHRYRFQLPEETSEPLEVARKLALRALELAPDSARGHHAFGIALWFTGQVKQCLEELETGLELNPNDPDLKAEAGLRYALLGNWPKAVTLLEDAYTRNPFQPGGYRVGLSLFHYMHGRYEEAVAEARKAVLPNVLFGSLLVAASAAELGSNDEAEAAVRHVLQINPSYGKVMVDDLLARKMNASIIVRLSESLTKAGLPMDRPPSAGGAPILRFSDKRRHGN